ncbi:glycoside-pentoside-hexuronide (GPH):cation symporter [Klebsiella sp. BIGb0407]|uniref:glycoside-pentoside-hexuronide (GPH):cation symporter n=1 Tax=Klebsiella sp. BIGb0407 TaxID=2940603 RepID=UPI0021673232|nr:glycoside-pentoside-hexuronide (GPH):cation symporter [Klebsiella sp. BIGb0407]MCS3431426.1 sugar (glycoside-pentoside-hexuronide) transporter [Klebsiella sp. BIGb0407]
MSESVVSTREKIGYGLGDTACNLVWQTVMLFMAYFYTDVFGLSPAHMGTMFLAVRAIDAVLDVCIGAIADRTRTSRGQFRPYIMWFAIPFGVVCTLTFYTPDFGYTGKLVYAYVSYALLSIIYSAINVPYCAMINNISKDSRERVSLQSWRFAFSALGGLIVSIAALPLVKYIGKGNIQEGYFYTMMIIGSLSIVFFYICFSTTHERYISPLDENKTSIWADLKTLCKNKDWLIMFILNIVNLVAVLFKGGSIIYYCNYVLKSPELSSWFMSAIIIASFFGAVCSSQLFKGIDKVKGFKYAMLLEALLLVLIYFIPPTMIWLIFALAIAINFIQAAATPLQWSMISDVVDCLEKESGKKLSGIVFSTNLFAIKLGIAIGGALIGWILAWNGYIGGVTEQSEQASQAISLLFTVYPAILVALLVLIMKKYSLNDLKVNALAKAL